MKTRLVIISDTHGQHWEMSIPEGDILIHAGDITLFGEDTVIRDFNVWLGELPHQHKLVIAGNHDYSFEQEPEKVVPLITNARYLRDETVVINGIKFYASPWQPVFLNMAFNLYPPLLAEKWALIPPDTDVLITHTPPFGYGDRTIRDEDVGCADLRKRVEQIKPRLHVFGHIHEAAGWYHNDYTTFINASSAGVGKHLAHPPVVYDFET